VALADKLETLVGMLGIGNLPTGDRDPFALRRHALGVIRMLIEQALPLALPELIELAAQTFAGKADFNPSRVKDELAGKFIYDRLAGSLREQGFSAQEVDAVLALRPPRLADVHPHLQAVRAFAALPEAPALAAANKRIGNILKDEAPAEAFDSGLLVQAEEQALAGQLAKLEATVDQRGLLVALADLAQPLEAFFTAVMVKCEDPALRAARLSLLHRLRKSFLQVADFSLWQ